jgi:two-component system KDP operon response regulator KdpE
MAYAEHPDAVILDVTMPKVDGWTVCHRLRQVCDNPVVMLTARSDSQDIVKGLNLGADDYIVKPCSLGELKARLRNALQRYSRRSTLDQECAWDDGCLRIDATMGIVTRDGECVDLTPTESRLLGYLVDHRGRIASHRELLEHVWGPQYADEVKYLSVYIRYLREKIEADPSNPHYILTRHRVGYYFAG